MLLDEGVLPIQCGGVWEALYVGRHEAPLGGVRKLAAHEINRQFLHMAHASPCGLLHQFSHVQHHVHLRAYKGELFHSVYTANLSSW